MRYSIIRAAAALLSVSQCANAITLDVNSQDSIKAAAKTIASNVMSLYTNTSTVPGLFASPYYWWEGGLAWDSMINYWFLTGDATYNEIVGNGLLFQTGQDLDYMPANQTKSEGNDDQGIWALAAMTAAEQGFPYPSSQSSNPSNTTWLQLAQNVFDDQAARWDNKTCGGGLRWQIFTFNAGYNYKNSATAGTFFELAARLARFTGNQTYYDWAEQVFEWSTATRLVSLQSNGANGSYAVWDGADTNSNCSQFNHIQWTESAGLYLGASAVMYNESDGTKDWSNALGLLYHGIVTTFAPNKILTEVACASLDNCDTDQLAYRAVLARALAQTLRTSNSTTGGTGLTASVSSLIQISAAGAAGQCSGGAKGTTCGSNWNNPVWDGSSGLGQDLSAMEIILANLALSAPSLANVNSTSSVGGSSAAHNSTSTGGNGTSTGSASAASQSTNSGSLTTCSLSTAALALACFFAPMLM